ncbi:MAG: immunoglobulin domain-containing protein, partial [Limisphaerales bacterium]
MNRRLFFLVIVLLAIFGGFARATITVRPWVPIFKGIDFASGQADTNEVRLQEVKALRINLTDPTVEFFSTPSNGDAPEETFGQTTTTFVQSYGVKVGVNANFFSPVSTIANEPRQLLGLAISQGAIVSPVEATWEMLLLTRSNLPSIVATAPTSLSNIWTAVAGSAILLVNGVNQGDFDSANPRTAVGFSQDNRYLYLIAIDGRQPGYSEGATFFETGEWLIRFGAYQGLNLDGGGSTAMSKMESGQAILLNRPSAGVQRVNGNHLGVFAPNLPPLILTPPQTQTVLIGENASLNVFAGGTTPLHYQWQFNGENILGAVQPTLSITNTQPVHSGIYTVVITNSYGAITSAPAILSAQYLLTTIETLGGIIIRNPNNASYPPNAVVSLTAAPDPGFIFTGWSGDATGTNNSVTVTMSGNKSVSATFSGTASDLIIDNPEASLVGSWTTNTIAADKFGADYILATVVSAGSSPTKTATYRPTIYTPGKYAVYAWYPTDTTRSTNAPWTIVFNGGTNLAISNQTIDGGSWRLLFTGRDFARGTNGYVRVANNAGGTARVMADAIKFVYGSAPTIATQPPNQTLLVGQSVLFNVIANGSSPLSYQWRFNNTAIPGATNFGYSISAAQTNHAGNYTVVVTNLYGATTSVVATLNINAPVFIAVHPQSQSVSQAANATFSVIAGGTAPFNYQWQFNGVDIAGATASTFTRTNVQPADGGNYSVRVTNFYGAALSSNATLTVSITPTPPFVTTQPQSQLLIAGQNVTLTVAANGTLPLYFQWRLNGNDLIGATSSTLFLENVQPMQSGGYSVFITNNSGAVTSGIATLTVDYSLTTLASLGGVVNRNPVQTHYSPNSSVTVSAVADAGFIFTGWSGDATGTNNPLTLIMSSNKIITANFLGAVADIVLDNTDPRLTLMGDWQLGNTASGRYGADYLFALTISGIATSNATYRPNITTPGKYNVYIWYPAGSNRSPTAPWLIASEDGADLVSVNQQTNGGQWLLIATGKNFSRGTNGFVRLSNNTGSSGTVVIADAVLFQFVSLPQITSQPQPQMVFVGENATFSVSATGPLLSYQWQFNGDVIPGATFSSFTRTNAQLVDAGNYSVMISNAAGLTNSAPAMLTVISPPAQPRFDSVALLPDGGIHFVLSGEAGFVYSMEISTHWVNWTTPPNIL